jgi:hypothetical protein
MSDRTHPASRTDAPLVPGRARVPALLGRLESRDLAIVLVGGAGVIAVSVWALAGAVATIVSSFFLGLFSFLGTAALAAVLIFIVRMVHADIRVEGEKLSRQIAEDIALKYPDPRGRKGRSFWR